MVISRAGKLERLRDALAREYEALSGLREQRARLISLAAGPKYPHKSHEAGWEIGEDILPLMRQAAQALSIQLAAERPRFLCSSNRVDRLAFSMHYENALNAYAKIMKMEEILREIVVNSFYSLGIGKVYMAESVPIWIEADQWMDPGRPFLQSISPHHFVYDTSATAFRHCSFLADRYRVRFDDVVTDSRFSSKLREKIKKQGPIRRGDMDETEPLKSISYDENELEPMLFLSDVFLPKESKIYTFVVDRDFNVTVDEPLAVVDWTGEETGPYHFLSLGPVPDKTTPSSIAQNLELLHSLANSLYRKLQRQAQQQKTINAGFKSDEQGITAARDALDEAWLGLENPEAFTRFRVGGPDQSVFSFFLNNLDQFDQQGGNIKYQLGTGASADTATQEGMIAANVSRSEGYNRMLFQGFLRPVARELARLLFESSTTVVQKQLTVGGMSIDDPWMGAVEEGSRLGEFTDYDIDVDMTPMRYKSPQERVMELTQTFQELLPLAPLTMQQGLMPDVQYYIKEKARLLNNPCLERLLVSVVPPEEQAGGAHERTLAPDMGPKEYIHRSQGPGRGGDQGSQNQLAMMAAGNADNAA